MVTAARVKRSAFFLVLVLMASVVQLAAQSSPAAASTTATIQNFDSSGNSLTKFDTDGNAIDIHEPYIATFNGVYYLYGTAMGCGSLASVGSHSPWCGDRVYTSTDLVHWINRGVLFDPTTQVWQNRCATDNPLGNTQSSCFRPKVLYNAATGKYVLWVNQGVNSNDSSSNPVTGHYYVLTSSSPTGPFTEVGTATLAQKWDNDETLYVDGTTGYVVYMQQQDGGGHPWRLVVEQLNASYTSGTGTYSYVGASNETGEAPAVFQASGRFYLVYSNPPCGFCSSGVTTYYRTATSLLGIWSAPTQLSSGTPGDASFCGGQSSSVTPITTTTGTSYLWQFDSWTTTGSSPATSDVFLAPLSFNGSGGINPMRCASYPNVSLTLPGADGSQVRPAGLDQSSGTSNFYDHCDIYGTRSRSQSFTPSASAVGSPARVSVAVHQQGGPNGPLTVQLRTANSDGTPTSTVVGSSTYQPADVSWSPRFVTVQSNGNLVGGQKYAVVLTSTATQGCYGQQFQDTGLYGGGNEHFSNDTATSWSSVEPFDLMFYTQTLPGGTQPAGSATWTFDEGSGSTAADSSGNGNTATLQGSAGWASAANAEVGNSALVLTGSGNADAPGRVVDTAQSFTVSAWVRLASVDGDVHAVASIDGSQQSGFYLEYCGFCNGGAFDLTMVNADSSNAAGVRASGTTHPVAGTWYHIVGVYDASANSVKLYVGANLEATSSLGFGPWSATGHVEIGRAKYNGAASNYWNGTLDDVRLDAGVFPPS